jgi:hypothetical protein
LNLHAITGTGTSSLRVCQFRHSRKILQTKRKRFAFTIISTHSLTGEIKGWKQKPEVI